LNRTPPASRGVASRLVLLAAMSAVAVMVTGAFLVWLVFFSSSAPEAPTIDAAASQVEASGPPAADGFVAADGTWVVDTPPGAPLEGTGSWVGFRVDEVLSNIGETQAVGRTPAVSGRIEVSGSTLVTAEIEADLTAIRSDQPRRDPAIQRALATSVHRTATFRSSAAVDLGREPAPGDTFEVRVPGVLAIQGVEQEVDATMRMRVLDEVVVVVGTLGIDFASFGVTMPRAPIVISVAEQGDLEWQLFLRRGA
jgi:hypothetical protein